MSCAHAFGDWCPECIENLVQKYNKLHLAAAEQREQLDVKCQQVKALRRIDQESVKRTSLLTTTILNLREQIATLTAENETLTAANKSLDSHCMVLQHDIRTFLAECDDEPRELLLGELSQQVVDLGLWNASQQQQIATLTAERDAMRRRAEAAESDWQEVTKARDEARALARQAANGWACYAKRGAEHDEIAEIHSALDQLAQVRGQ